MNKNISKVISKIQAMEKEHTNKNIKNGAGITDFLIRKFNH